MAGANFGVTRHNNARSRPPARASVGTPNTRRFKGKMPNFVKAAGASPGVKK